MQTVCLACNIKGSGMIAIYQHPNGLHEMFEGVSGVSVNMIENLKMLGNGTFLFYCQLLPDDHICILCYDDLKAAHNFRKKCQQNNFTRLQSNKITEVPVKSNTTQKPTEIQEITTTTSQIIENAIDQEVLVVFKQSEIGIEDNGDIETMELIEEELVDNSLEIEDDDPETTDNQDAKSKRLNIFKRLHEKMCQYCFKEFETVDQMNEHLNIHKNEDRPYTCIYEKCNAKFKDKVGFRNHFRIHSSDNKYSCRFCEKKFNQKGNLVSHERIHEGKKPFSCPHCSKAFAESGNLKNHIRTHTDERPYTCSVCEKKFKTHYSHKVHLRQHTNERPYACDNCGKSFTSSGKLNIHKRIHTGDRPFKCLFTGCPARFTDSSGLKRHSKVHK